ncbi:MAG: UDP-N-acetylmuramoyl-L-alanine--D-glutamate ligase [Clostridia bacterium]
MKNKKVAVLGIGISNTPLVKLLYKMDAQVTVFDRSEGNKLMDTISNFEGMKVSFCLGNDYLKELKGFNYIFRSPGIRFDIPELVAENKSGAVVTSEIEVFLDVCPAKIFGVTGSDGKTTTTTLICKILNDSGYKCWIGGNIGTPLLDKIDGITEDDMVILELSSFQLQTMQKSPSVAVITNLTQNHLDFHKSYAEYKSAKENIFRHQTKSNVTILNYDSEVTRDFSKLIKSNFVFFSRLKKLDRGFYVNNGKIVYSNGTDETEILNTGDILIPGNHNIENYLAAIAATYPYTNVESINNVARTFKGVEHRLELVRELNGVRFYNSSIDSSPNRTTAALSTFDQPVILLAGGKDKNITYKDIGKVIAQKVKCLLLIGPTGPLIEKSLRDEIAKTGKGSDISIIYCDSYDELVKTAYRKARTGDVILLSPASTSFDMFKNFEERGNLFKRIVNELK